MVRWITLRGVCFQDYSRLGVLRITLGVLKESFKSWFGNIPSLGWNKVSWSEGGNIPSLD